MFLDQDAIPTFVEVKRASDSRIRREVVGQMLDYAANGLKYWPVEAIQGFLASPDATPDEAITRTFGGEVDPSEYWVRLKENLAEGRVRLLFVADHVPSELLAVVEFLNRQMDRTEVLAVEIPQFVGEGLRTLAPRVYGQTQEARQRKGSSSGGGRKWDEVSFFAEIGDHFGESEAEFVRRFYDWNVAEGLQIVWGEGKRTGSFQGRFTIDGRAYIPAVCYTSGGIEFELFWMRSWPPFDQIEKRREFVHMLNRIPGADIPDDDETLLNKRPSVMFSTLAGTTAFEPLVDALRWFQTESRAWAGTQK